MSTVPPGLARFAADLHDMWTQLCDKPEHADFFEMFTVSPIGDVTIQLYTADGLTAKFYEEGIEFYPKESE